MSEVYLLKHVILICLLMLPLLIQSLGAAELLDMMLLTSEKAVDGLKSKDVSEPDLIRFIAFLRKNAIERLDKQTLMSVCADPTFPASHRRHCLVQLISLHLDSGSTFGDFLGLIGHGAALGEKGKLDVLGFNSSGELATDWAKHETWVYCEPGLPDADWTRFWLLLDGEIAAEEWNKPPTALTDALHDPNSPLAKYRIKRVVIQTADPADELLTLVSSAPTTQPTTKAGG